MESSGSFNSSVVNADTAGDDSSSDFNALAYNFSILNSNKQGRINSSNMTIQFFPENGEQGRQPSVPRRKEWLDLTCKKLDNGGGPAEQGIAVVHLQPRQMGKKSRRGPRSKSSQYRGVTYYRRTGRWESHIWDCGKQVYLGGFDTAHAAARAYDRAAIKFRGVDADINFDVCDYAEDINHHRLLQRKLKVQGSDTAQMRVMGSSHGAASGEEVHISGVIRYRNGSCKGLRQGCHEMQWKGSSHQL